MWVEDVLVRAAQGTCCICMSVYMHECQHMRACYSRTYAYTQT